MFCFETHEIRVLCIWLFVLIFAVLTAYIQNIFKGYRLVMFAIRQDAGLVLVHWHVITWGMLNIFWKLLLLVVLYPVVKIDISKLVRLVHVVVNWRQPQNPSSFHYDSELLRYFGITASEWSLGLLYI